ncbi:MAG TPA: type II secretion system protein GspG [Pyrinomonadaceae bacterium]|nr:type II secretion system protein GspG [Pyrinomonadaceae bacterium]
MRRFIRVHLWLITVALFAIVGPVPARADLSQKQARKIIQTIGGWSLPGSAVRLQIRSNSAESAEASAEIQAVFRLRLYEGHWRLWEIRSAPDRWERLEVIARAAKVDLPEDECDASPQFARGRFSTALTTKRARCVVASLFGVALPSDDVRIKEISLVGFSIGSESSALVTALIRVDFRFARDKSGWQVTEFKSGARNWVNINDLPAAINEAKRSAASDELSIIARALGDYHRDRGYFVVSDKESVLIDHLSPRYLARVIRVDPWHRPYQYDGQQDRYSLRSLGPDGKPNTPDDVVVAGP